MIKAPTIKIIALNGFIITWISLIKQIFNKSSAIYLEYLDNYLSQLALTLFVADLAV